MVEMSSQYRCRCRVEINGHQLVRRTGCAGHFRHRLIALLAYAAVGLSACGGGSLDPAVHVTGVVEAPDGEIAAAPGLWRRFVSAVLPSARALTGLDPVGAGVAVRLEQIDASGKVTNVLATDQTRSDGTYDHALASAEQPGSSLIVSVGEDDTLMRAFVSGEAVDINPATEATVRLVLDSEFALANFSAADLQSIQAAVDTATADVIAGGSIAVANARAEQRAADSAEVQAAIDEAGAP